MSWERIRLGDCCEITSSKRIFYSEYTDYGIPFYRSKEIIEFSQGQSISEPLYIANQRYHEIKNRFGVPVAGDMLLTSVGTIGIPYIVKETDEFYFKDGNLTWFRNFTSKLCARYLYYWVISKEGNGVLNNTTIGSSQKALTISALKNVEITVPSIGKQRRIADILSAYDDLIENNRKQIKLLEEAAQRLYKEWFVDLRFPGHEHTKIVDGVPEGWDYIPLGKTISYEIGGGWGEDFVTGKNECPGFVIRGTDIDDIKKGNLLSIPYRFHVQGNLLSRKLQDGDIIFEVSGGSKNAGVAKTLLMTESLLSVWKKPVICASFCKLIRFDKPHISQYIYDCLQYWRTVGETQEYEKKSASNIINYRWKEFLKQKSVLIPEQGLLLQYVGISSSLYKQAITCSIAISKAMQARDCLLPKLMSGEVEV